MTRKKKKAYKHHAKRRSRRWWFTGDMAFSTILISVVFLGGILLVFGLGSTSLSTEPKPTPTPRPTFVPAPTPTPIPGAPTNTPTPGLPPPTATPTNVPPPPPGPGGAGMWVAPSAIASLPTSGAAWTSMKAAADGNWGSADIKNQDSDHDVHTLAGALVYARTGDASYRTKVANAIMSAINTENGGRVLALGRNLNSYVIAADLIDLKTFSPSQDQQFRSWLTSVRNETMTECGTLIECHERRPNNWGTLAGGSRIAADIYIGDTADLARAAQVFKGWLGDRASYAGFQYGDLSWQCNVSAPVGINPAGCTKSGHNIDGVVPDDQRRGGGFTWPAPKENYVWGGLSGAVIQAQLLSRAGYDAWGWENQAIKRSMDWLYTVNNYPPVGNDTWVPYLVNKAYGTNYSSTSPSRFGTSMGWTDWTFQ